MNQPTSTAPDTGATDALPTVVIVGRPNVGKSTLFNRIVGHQVAIVEDRPGVTRDRKEVEAEWLGTHFLLVDTGGWLPGGSELDEKVSRQVEAAVKAADVVLFVVDASVGLTDDDESVANWLRRIHAPVVVVANKADNDRRENEMWEFLGLGMGEPVPVSALHGRRAGDLLDVVVAQFPEGAGREPATSVDGIPVDEDGEQLWRPDDVPPPRVAIVGRPNVGKSSLLNALIGTDRAIVSEVPGTTRDPIDTEIMFEKQRVRLIDTAGIRRRGKVERGIEKYSVLRSLRGIDRADVALLLIDAVDGVTAQDTHVAGYVLERFKSVVVVVNKWDALEKDAYTMVEFTKKVRSDLHFLDYVPVIFISALTHQRIHTVLPTAMAVAEARRHRLSTAEFNDVLRAAYDVNQPPSRQGRPLRIYYGTQVDVAPPVFALFVNDPDLVHFSYARYLENQIRRHYEFLGTPIRLLFRPREGRGR